MSPTCQNLLGAQHAQRGFVLFHPRRWFCFIHSRWCFVTSLRFCAPPRMMPGSLALGCPFIAIAPLPDYSTYTAAGVRRRLSGDQNHALGCACPAAACAAAAAGSHADGAAASDGVPLARPCPCLGRHGPPLPLPAPRPALPLLPSLPARPPPRCRLHQMRRQLSVAAAVLGAAGRPSR